MFFWNNDHKQFLNGGECLYSDSAFKKFSSHPRFKFISFAAFGEMLDGQLRSGLITPPKLNSNPESIISHQELAFDDSDALEFYKDWLIKRRMLERLRLSDHDRSLLLKHVMNVTKGHVGLFVRAFSELYVRIPKVEQWSNFEKIRELLMKTEFLVSWTGTRACNMVHQIKSNTPENRIMFAICFTGGLTKEQVAIVVDSDDTMKRDATEVLAQMMKAFYIVESRFSNDKVLYTFPSPLVQWRFLLYKFGSTIHPSEKKITFKSFVHEVIATMDSEALEKSLGYSLKNLNLSNWLNSNKSHDRFLGC
jgi:hypothetical protein